MGRDYKDEYERFQKKLIGKRVELNRFNRKKGTYGNGDGLDASHQADGSLKMEPESKNRGRKEEKKKKPKTVTGRRGGNRSTTRSSGRASFGRNRGRGARTSSSCRSGNCP